MRLLMLLVAFVAASIFSAFSAFSAFADLRDPQWIRDLPPELEATPVEISSAWYGARAL